MKGLMEYIMTLIMIFGGIMMMGLFMQRHDSELKMRDYQIDIDNDSIYIWDGNTPKGAVEWQNNKFDSLLLNDNQ